MSPPDLRAATCPPGGTTTGRTALTGHQLGVVLRAAHQALADGGSAVVTPSKVSRSARRFGHLLHRAQLTFDEFVSLSPQRQRAALDDPELLRLVAYLDPTGETAVDNVKKERGF